MEQSKEPVKLTPAVVFLLLQFPTVLLAAELKRRAAERERQIGVSKKQL